MSSAPNKRLPVRAGPPNHDVAVQRLRPAEERAKPRTGAPQDSGLICCHSLSADLAENHKNSAWQSYGKVLVDTNYSPSNLSEWDYSIVSCSTEKNDWDLGSFVSHNWNSPSFAPELPPADSQLRSAPGEHTEIQTFSPSG